MVFSSKFIKAIPLNLIKIQNKESYIKSEVARWTNIGCDMQTKPIKTNTFRLHNFKVDHYSSLKTTFSSKFIKAISLNSNKRKNLETGKDGSLGRQQYRV